MIQRQTIVGLIAVGAIAAACDDDVGCFTEGVKQTDKGCECPAGTHYELKPGSKSDSWCLDDRPGAIPEGSSGISDAGQEHDNVDTPDAHSAGMDSSQMSDCKKNACGGCGEIAHTIGEPCTNGGVGACAFPGRYDCFGGTMVCGAPPPTPQTEICDGIDNDCIDGVDNGLHNVCGGGCSSDLSKKGTPCTVGEGACAGAGVWECSGQEALLCTAKEQPKNSCGKCGPDLVEDCSTPLVDDNCNGTVNEYCAVLALAAGGQTDPLRSNTRIPSSTAHTCSLHTNGTVSCWGANYNGQLGDGTTTKRRVPVHVVGLEDVETLAVGGDHSCAKLTSGAVRCWGRNDFGQLGLGTTEDSLTPTEIPALAGAAEISLGGNHSCARFNNGRLSCWGKNARGQVGDGTQTDRTQPVPISVASNVIKVATGYEHTCVRFASNSLSCWGDNVHGQIGDGTEQERAVPTQVSEPGSAIDVVAGGWHTCALTPSRTVLCWGQNYVGEGGTDSRADQLAPTAVPALSNAEQLALGRLHTCVRVSSGQVGCFGHNGYGQLGDGMAITARSSWSPAIGVAGAQEVSAGLDQSCARTVTGVLCWGGQNLDGDLGNGSDLKETGYSMPTAVFAF